MDLFQCTIDAVEKYFVNLDKTDRHVVIAYLYFYRQCGSINTKNRVTEITVEKF